MTYQSSIKEFHWIIILVKYVSGTQIKNFILCVQALSTAQHYCENLKCPCNIFLCNLCPFISLVSIHYSCVGSTPGYVQEMLVNSKILHGVAQSFQANARVASPRCYKSFHPRPYSLMILSFSTSSLKCRTVI
jgi:hypothetical protein